MVLLQVRALRCVILDMARDCERFGVSHAMQPSHMGIQGRVNKK